MSDPLAASVALTVLTAVDRDGLLQGIELVSDKVTKAPADQLGAQVTAGLEILEDAIATVLKQ